MMNVDIMEGFVCDNRDKSVSYQRVQKIFVEAFSLVPIFKCDLKDTWHCWECYLWASLPQSVRAGKPNTIIYAKQTH